MMFKFLPRTLPKYYKNCSKFRFITTSVFLETFCMAWPNNAAFIFCNNMFIYKGDFRKSGSVVREDLMGTMIAGWKIYPIS
jgi:hypothetical protein